MYPIVLKKCLFASLCLFFFITSPAQNITRKQTNAVRTEGGLKIDGIINEPEWLTAPMNTDFIQKEPKPSLLATFKTETRVLYSNTSIYIAATLFDPRPDSIQKELTLRDNFGNDDIFCLILDTYSDGNNGFNFCVLASGTQCDAKVFPSDGDGINSSGEDWSWSAVWKSAVKINANSWTVEMEIPYSAIRFPNAAEQKWRVNFGRHIKRYRETSFWNEINPKINGFINQSGEIAGIKDIKSPIRLQATPFVSAYAQNNFDKNSTPKSSWGRSFNAGMDVKYGINDAFTLDMTLIPDFGQVRSDNKVLNLTPFEVRFDENRQFFTEGVELFNKGNFFYSRRVGSIPNYFWNKLYDGLKGGETVVNTPNEAQLYNASKISGRTSKGLGIGFFNATAAPTFATIKSESGSEKEREITPLTNYNMLSFDQNLPNNSFLTLVNTNVMRSGGAYDANVTGVNFNIKNKSNAYSVQGGGGVAQRIFSDKNDISHKYTLGVSKISGTWRWDTWHQLESWNYNPNDLGFLNAPNENSWGAGFGINKFNTKRFQEYRVYNWVEYSKLHKPSVFADFSINNEAFFLTKKVFAFGFNTSFQPVNNHDYFEPRTKDFSRFFEKAKNAKLGAFISTDYRKPFAFDLGYNYRFFTQRGQNSNSAFFSPRFRFNDHIALLWSINVTQETNYPNFVSKDNTSIGYAALPANAIVLGERQQWEIVNTPSVKWNFNHLMGLDVRFRHYWARVNYAQFYELGQKGELKPAAYTGKDIANNTLHNTNFNLFNVDANFTWRFAPGSDFIVNWKQNIASENDDIINNYLYNTSRLFNNPMSNSFSVKMIYFVDYLTFMKKK